MIQEEKNNSEKFPIHISDMPYWSGMPYWITVFGKVIGEAVYIEVHSSVHKTKVWTMPTGFQIEYWNDYNKTAMQDILTKIVERYGLVQVTRWE
jgi:hypothetical protein